MRVIEWRIKSEIGAIVEPVRNLIHDDPRQITDALLDEYGQHALRIAARTDLLSIEEFPPDHDGESSINLYELSQDDGGSWCVSQKVEDLVVRFAQQNKSWGYDRIAGALANVGHEISDQTVSRHRSESYATG